MWNSSRLRAEFNINYKVPTLTFLLLPKATAKWKSYFIHCAWALFASCKRVSHYFFSETICIRVSTEFYFSMFNIYVFILFFCHNPASLLLKYLKKTSTTHIPSSFLPRRTASFHLFLWTPFALFLRSHRTSKQRSYAHPVFKYLP